MNELYADRILDIVITGTVVRINFGSLGPHTSAEDKPALEPRQRVVMPIEGFLQSFGVILQSMQQLEKQGVIKRTPATAAQAETLAADKAGRGSDRFGA